MITEKEFMRQLDSMMDKILSKQWFDTFKCIEPEPTTQKIDGKEVYYRLITMPYFSKLYQSKTQRLYQFLYSDGTIIGYDIKRPESKKNKVQFWKEEKL